MKQNKKIEKVAKSNKQENMVFNWESKKAEEFNSSIELLRNLEWFLNGLECKPEDRKNIKKLRDKVLKNTLSLSLLKGGNE